MCEGEVLLTEAWVVVVCCEVLVLGELACLLAAIVACRRDWQRNECLSKPFNPAQLLGSVRTPSLLPSESMTSSPSTHGYMHYSCPACHSTLCNPHPDTGIHC